MKRLRSATGAHLRGKRKLSKNEARIRYERAADALHGWAKNFIECIARFGVMAFREGGLSLKYWEALSRFENARLALWKCEKPDSPVQQL